MQIHVIRPGDTLWRLSQQYGIPLHDLINSNEIPNPDQLVAVRHWSFLFGEATTGCNQVKP